MVKLGQTSWLAVCLAASWVPAAALLSAAPAHGTPDGPCGQYEPGPTVNFSSPAWWPNKSCLLGYTKMFEVLQLQYRQDVARGAPPLNSPINASGDITACRDMLPVAHQNDWQFNYRIDESAFLEGCEEGKRQAIAAGYAH